MRTLKHLPVNEWPEADREAFRAAYEPGDVFDETAGPGAHLAEGSRRMIQFTYRRWLGFLKANYPDDLSMPPPERITPERVRAFIDHLSAQIRPSSVAIAAAHLYAAARLIAPTTDWAWLRSIKSRLASRARPRTDSIALFPLCKRSTSASSLWTPRSCCQPAVTSNAKSNIATGCFWPCSAFGRYAVAALPPSPSAVILSSMMQVYARYSSDLQRAASIEDQLLVCTERVVREKWTLAATYTDRGISGASHLRAWLSETP